MNQISKIIKTAILSSIALSLSGCGQGIGGMSLAPKQTDTSTGFALTLSKKEVGQTIQELQQDVQSRQSYSGRFSNQ